MKKIGDEIGDAPALAPDRPAPRPLSRRRLLAGAAATGAVASLPRFAIGQPA